MSNTIHTLKTMIETISDIEALTLRCHSEHSKYYISEATLCYRSGAYRAAIVSTWIAVVFDLIDKVRELSISGDAAAQAALDQYENFLNEINKGNQQGFSKALEFEREILAICRDQLQFFDQQQFIDLSRLKEDRHRCAHPSFQEIGSPYAPSAEQARLHIRNAIVHVLAQPPVQGKAAITRIKNIIVSEFFPKEKEKAILELKHAGLNKPTPVLVKNLIDQLLFGFLTPTDVIYHKTQAITALNAILDIFPAIFEDRITRQANKIILNTLDNNEIAWAIYLIMNTKTAWSSLDQTGKNKIERYIDLTNFEEIMPALPVFSEIEELLPVVENRISTLQASQLAKALSIPKLQTIGKPYALNILSTANSWDKVNQTFNDFIFPIFSTLTVNDIEEIMKFPKTGADLHGANGFRLFIERIKQTNIIENSRLNELLVLHGFSYLVPQPNNELKRI